MTNVSVLMPFARCNETNLIIGIEEASRGHKCNCRCLSCNTPVTARKADVNQWHFAHRTDKVCTSNECNFSPVTAIALILRQQISSLQNFDLDDWSFDDVMWQLDLNINGVMIDAFARDTTNSLSIAVEIPFANDKGTSLEDLVSVADIVLSIDTHAIATYLFAEHSKATLLRPAQIFDLLLEHWHKWVKNLHPSAQEPESVNSVSVDDDLTKELIQPSHFPVPNAPPKAKCVCCDKHEATYGKGLLCKGCVWKHVGPDFNNLTDMINFYRNRI
ncbi:hypothetical protein [Vibrio scophthalmi]|uniref:PI-3 kinase family phosphatidylinositol kinase/protein kinase n=1 Tax=Vibrio scophthalmi LMG 19158 TaxID=870967 RepID=F9RIA6_9VIBR|nr:hypothetical protein [Vibrio scophthalmi]EGU42438.1 PI-3 kinase family phosphatidylinositol kinase/protein kinase [Vibrio scophthalmi LMG 19158]